MTRLNFQRLFMAVALLVVSCVADVEFASFKLSTPRTSLSAVEAGERVFFVGGFEHGDQRATRTVDVYDLVAQNMTSPILLGQSRAFITPVVIEPNIYFVGGLQYENRILIYDSDLHQLVDYGTGPTVVKPRKLAFENSHLIVLGVSGVDVLDVQYNTWIDTAPLTELLAGLTNYAMITHRGLVLVLGGYNATTAVSSNSAWVYDISNGTLQEYAGVVPAPFTADSVIGSIESNGVITIERNNNSGFFLFYVESTEVWRKEDLTNIYQSYSVQKTTFLFNATTLRTIDWATGKSEDTDFGTNLVHTFMLNDLVCYIKRVEGALEFYVYDPLTGLWELKLTDYAVFLAVRMGVNLQNWHVFFTLTGNVYGFNPTTGVYHPVTDTDIFFQSVFNLIPAEEADTVWIFENTTNRVTKTIFDNLGISNTIKQAAVALAPQVRLGEYFLNFTGKVMNVNNLNALTSFNLTMKAPFIAYNNKYLAWMESLQTTYDLARVHYNYVDVYNYVTDEWGNSTAMPGELTQAFARSRIFYSAAALDNKLVVWAGSVIAVYDPAAGLWSTHTNYTQSKYNNEELSPVHKPVPVALGSAYMRTNSNFFDVFSATGLFETWNQTSFAPTVEDYANYIFHQTLVSNDSKIYVTCRAFGAPLSTVRYNTLFIYDARTDKWEYEQLENALYDVPVIALAGDFLLALQNDGLLSFWDRVNRFWSSQQLDFIFTPAIALETKKANLTFFAGGANQWGSWVDRVMVIPHTAIVATVPPKADNSTTIVQLPQSTPAGLSDGELAAAIVVPVGAALIGAALLVFFLVRRQKRKRDWSNTTIGLAGKYGQWFIPYENIKFGTQLGQGASGQVFKGTWKNTAVALKVSMTQANSTIVGELELMIQLRPHPNVIQLFGFSVHPETDSIILVVEFCNGGSLDDVLFDGSHPITLAQKISWLLCMAKGIEHLHANNIVHRDIAARNVLLHQNEPKITDFGMSRLIDEAKQRGTTKSELGPIRWMSPESLKNKEYSNKSDIWSFGILMYEVIAQSEPHLDADPIEVGRLIRDIGKTPTIPSECHTELAQVMQECWHLSPEKRISIDKIVTQLEALQTLNSKVL